MQSPTLHPNARPLTEADLLAIADPLDDEGFLDMGPPLPPAGITTSADVRGGMEGPLYSDGEMLDPTVMGEGLAGSKMFIPAESGDGQLATEAPNPLGPQANHDQVIVYDCRVRQQAVQRAKIRHYLTKRCQETGHNHRAFYPTEAKAIAAVGLRFKEEAPTIPCKSPRCLTRAGTKKLFSSSDAMEEHFRLKHKREFARAERERTRDREERAIAAQERQADIMENFIRTVQRTGAISEQAVEPGQKAISPIITPAEPGPAPQPLDIPIPEGSPTMEWKVVEIAAWLDREGIERPAKLGGVSRRDMLALVPDLE